MTETNTSKDLKVSNIHPSPNSPINNFSHLSKNGDHANHQYSSKVEQNGASLNEEECKTLAPNNQNNNNDLSETSKERFNQIDPDAKSQMKGDTYNEQNTKMDIELDSEQNQEKFENYNKESIQQSNPQNSKEMPIYNNKQFNQRQSDPTQQNNFNAGQYPSYNGSSDQNTRHWHYAHYTHNSHNDYRNKATQLKCLVLECIENHSYHYCKFCGDTNSNHFSSQCAKNPQNVRNFNYNPRASEHFNKPINNYQSMGQVSTKCAYPNCPETHLSHFCKFCNRSNHLSTECRDNRDNNSNIFKESNEWPPKTCSYPNCPENHPHHFCKFCSKSGHLSTECIDKSNKVDEFNETLPIKDLPAIKKKDYFVKDMYYDSKIKPVSETSKSLFSRFFDRIKQMMDFFKFGKSDTTIKLPHEDKFKWQEISTILNEFIDGKMQTFDQFEYNMSILYSMGSRYPMGRMTNFRYFVVENDKNLKINFFGEILPFMAGLALNLPKLFPNELKILIQNKDDNLEFTKIQIGCLIAHMFFGTISGRNSHKMHEIISFQQILCFPDEANIQKLYCLFNYFKNVMSWDLPHTNLMIQYSRKVSKKVNRVSDWLVSREVLQPFKIENKGGIEAKDIKNAIQVNFANKFIGGGALTTGAVQEEIRYFVSPECLPSIMLFECFEDNEVGYLFGTEKINAYKGYGSGFTYVGDFPTVSKNNENGDMVDDSILALDAIQFKYSNDQYLEENILRELNKAYLGFKTDPQKKTIMTGKWGCGVFKGDPQLKFLLQWIACSQCKKEMVFFSVGDENLEKADLMLSLVDRMEVGALIEKILKFRPYGRLKLFEYILTSI